MSTCWLILVRHKCRTIFDVKCAAHIFKLWASRCHLNQHHLQNMCLWWYSLISWRRDFQIFSEWWWSVSIFSIINSITFIFIFYVFFVSFWNFFIFQSFRLLFWKHVYLLKSQFLLTDYLIFITTEDNVQFIFREVVKVITCWL